MDMILHAVAVIVLNYVNYSMTMECVDRIKDSKSRIVIVDNNSPNESFEILKKRYISNNNIFVVKSDRNGGYAYGNNFGARWAKENIVGLRYIAIMNPDVVLESDTLQILACFLEKHEDVAVVAPLIIETGNKTVDSTGWYLWSKKEIIRSAGYFGAKKIQKKSFGKVAVEDGHILQFVDVVKGCFFLVKMESFFNFGLLDEDTFLYGEEEILAYKVKSNHMEEVVLLDQYCYHNHAKTNKPIDLNWIQKRLKNTYNSRRILLEKYYSAGVLELVVYDINVFVHVYFVTAVVYFLKKILR